MKTSQITDQFELGEPRRLPARPAGIRDSAGSLQAASSKQGLGAAGSRQGARGQGGSARLGATAPPGEVCFLSPACHGQARITASFGTGDRRHLSCVSFEKSFLQPWRWTQRREKIREPRTQPGPQVTLGKPRRCLFTGQDARWDASVAGTPLHNPWQPQRMGATPTPEKI